MERFPLDSSKYKDGTDRWRTGIFYRDKKLSPYAAYTFEEGRQVFLESSTEYEAAMKFVTSWEHWKEIVKSPSCAPMVALWREEKLLKDQTKARKILWESAEKGNHTAARFIYEAKKEERQQRQKQQEQKLADQREEELLMKSASNLVKLKSQTK